MVTSVEKSQEVSEKAKALALFNNVHNLSPATSNKDEAQGQLAIIEALKVAPRLQNLFLEIRGLIYDERTKQTVQISKPIMNIDGAFRLIKIIQHIAEETEWANFPEDEIGKRIYFHFAQNFPYFTFYHEEYELDPADFSYVSTALITFIDSAFHKARNGKWINTVGKVYSEDMLGKVFNADKEKKSESWLQKLNVFRKAN
jgi:hypothetical protein